MLCLPAILCVSFAKIVSFLYLGPGDDHFHAAGAERDLVIPSSALLVPLASFPYLVANEGIGLRVTQSPGCSTLQLCQTNQM